MSGKTAFCNNRYFKLSTIPQGDFQSLARLHGVLYAQTETAWGSCLAAFIGQQLCLLEFMQPLKDIQEILNNRFGSRASFFESQVAAQLAEKILGEPWEASSPIEILAPGTAFRHLVWSRLLEIPAGAAISYSQLAACCGRPRATRACANAVAANRIFWLVPCHRVIKADGKLHRYHWGAALKKQMLETEINVLNSLRRKSGP